MSWSMKKDRELVEFARKGLSVEKIAHVLDVSLPQIIKAARRLGISLRLKPFKIDRSLKAKK